MIICGALSSAAPVDVAPDDVDTAVPSAPAPVAVTTPRRRPLLRKRNNDIVSPPVKEVVPILKQVHEVNVDGSYTFGYEGGDGSFRVETKDANGYIKGKFGYVDLEGRTQVIGIYSIGYF